MTGTKAREPTRSVPLLAAALLALGTVLSIARRDAYWAAVGVLAIGLAVLPFLRDGGRDGPPVDPLALLIALPYIAAPLLGTEGGGLLPMRSLPYLVLSSVALFALSIVAVARIGSVGRLRLNLEFGMQAAFMLYASLVIIQGPVYLYSGPWLGTSAISSNGEFMRYVVPAVIGGLLLTFGSYAVARERLRRQAGREEGR